MGQQLDWLDTKCPFTARDEREQSGLRLVNCDRAGAEAHVTAASINCKHQKKGENSSLLRVLV